MTAEERRLGDCLLYACNLEVFWNYYMVAENVMWDDAWKAAAQNFYEAYQDVLALDASLGTERLGSVTLADVAAKILVQANSSKDESRAVDLFDLAEYSWFFTNVRTKLARLLGLNAPTAGLQLDHISSLTSHLQFRGHFPPLSIAVHLDRLIYEASKIESIVIIGDIRHSQDLMTFAKNSEDFSTRLSDFLDQTRTILFKHGG